MVSPNLNKRDMMQIPVLSAKFLIQKKPDAGFFSKWSAQHPWHSTLIPVYEWKQVLFVACSGSPEVVEITDRQVMFVHLDSASMKKLWDEFQASASASLDFKSRSSFQEEIVLQDTPPVSAEFPESIDDLLDLDHPETSKSKAAPSTAVFNKPEPKYSVPELESSIKAGISAPENFEITRLSVKALKSAPVENLEAWVEAVFQQMSGSFQKSMILLKQGDQLRPWKWDARFEGEDSDSSSYSLINPSAFRIVLRSQKPFHGPVVNNEIMKKFFAQWNHNEVPEHLTIAPLVVNEHVIGMVMGIGDQSANVKSALNLSEKMAVSITNQIQAQTRESKVA